MNAVKSATGGLKRDLPIVLNRTAVALLIICLSTTGCFFILVKEEVRESLASTVIVGCVSTAFPGNGPIIVAAY